MERKRGDAGRTIESGFRSEVIDSVLISCYEFTEMLVGIDFDFTI